MKPYLNSSKYSYSLRKLLFLINIVISCTLIFLGTWSDLFGVNGLIVVVMGFIIFVVLGCISANFDISHPFVWFNVVFMLYSLSTPILNLQGAYYYYKGYSQWFNYHQMVIAQFLAVLVFSLAVTPKVVSFDLESYKRTETDPIYRGSYYLLIICIIVSLSHLIAVVQSGFVIKTELITHYNPLYGLSFIWNILDVALITMLLQKRLQTGKLPWGFILIMTGYISFAVLISGERGPLFRYLLILVILIHILFKKIKLRYFLLAIFLGVYLSTILGAFKSFLLTDLRLADMPGILNLEDSNILETMLMDEFRSASDNLGVALQMVPSSISYLYGRLVLNDLIRAIIPGFLFDRNTFYSTMTWFNETFFSRAYSTGMGMGFSLVAYSYVNFGYPGVAGLFLFLGWLTKKLYHKAGQSNIYLISYLGFIGVLITSIRGDMTYIVSQSWKHILVPILLMIWFGRIMRKEGQPISTGSTIRKPCLSPRRIAARGPQR